MGMGAPLAVAFQAQGQTSRTPALHGNGTCICDLLVLRLGMPGMRLISWCWCCLPLGRVGPGAGNPGAEELGGAELGDKQWGLAPITPHPLPLPFLWLQVPKGPRAQGHPSKRFWALACLEAV
jgi:hypothetical protein